MREGGSEGMRGGCERVRECVRECLRACVRACACEFVKSARQREPEKKNTHTCSAISSPGNG